MTILEDDVIPTRNKLSLTKYQYYKKPTLHSTTGQYKRKGARSESNLPIKKQATETMINGYRSNDNHRNSGDIANDCPVATLANMGNTCFLNSVIYTLRFAPTFLHNLHHLIDDLAKVSSRLGQNKAKSSSLGRSTGPISGPSSRSTSSKDLLSLGSTNDIIPKSKVQIVTEKFHELFMSLHSIEENRKKDPTDAFQPVAFLQAVREANYIFEGNHQQDAHELLVYLLDNIRETCDMLAQQIQHYPEVLTESEVPASTTNSKLWVVRKSWKKPQKKKDKAVINEEQSNGACMTDTEDASSVEGNSDNNNKRKLGYNFVAEDFEGITLRRTKCLECESVTERKETFYDIPVPITVSNEVDFEDSPSDIYRKACVTSEKLCESNKYLCETCKRYNEASREVSFEKLPNIMVLQLKRFTTTTSGVQKVNTYMPTPLEMACFCDTCCKVSEEVPLHRYQLCCVIMHLGGTMASGHYIAYVRASDQQDDYANCPRDLPKGSLSASSSEKGLNILKFLKPSSFSDAKNGLPTSKNNVLNGVRVCRSKSCCGIKLNKNVVENVINSYARRNGQEITWKGDVQQDMWLECDDETIRPITSQEFQELLGYKANSTSTPYLLFYSKITDMLDD